MIDEDFSEQVKGYNSEIERYDKSLYDGNHKIMRFHIIFFQKWQAINFEDEIFLRRGEL